VGKSNKEIEELKIKMVDLGGVKKPALKKVRMSASAMLTALLGTKHTVNMELRAGLKPVTKEKKEEPESYVESLPCRVTRAQQEFVSLAPDSRYELVNDRTLTGFIMLRNKRPDEPKELVSLKQTDNAGVYGNEPDPPADFIYTGV